MDLIFIAVPKCAGTSTVEFLKQKIGMKLFLSVNCNKTSLEHISRFDNTGNSCFSHADIGKLVETKVITKDYYKSSFKFCFVRNPWDRVVSLYFYQKNKIKMSFKELIKHLYNHRHSIASLDVYNKVLARDKTIFTYAAWNQMINWIPGDIDFIGRFENYEEDLRQVLSLAKIDVSESDVVPHINKTDHKNYREYYDEDTKQMIAEMYKDDIERFNYTF